MKRETICLIIACLISFILTAGIMNWRMEIVHAELSDTQQSLAKEVFRFHVIAENGEVYSSPAPKGTLVNGVGAGDSMVAGFMAGWMEKQDYEHAFHMGVATGSASAFSEYLATRPEVEEVYKQLV